jgi:hypothetical protein
MEKMPVKRGRGDLNLYSKETEFLLILNEIKNQTGIGQIG